MKKIVFIAAMLFAVAFVNAQTKDSTQKEKIVYVVDKTDTVKVETLVYKAADGSVRWCSPGWQIFKGKIRVEGKEAQWIERNLVDALDDKKRKVNPL